MNQYYQPGKIQQYSNVQPVGKFIFLYLITGGFYLWPWSYKNWKFLKEREGLKGSVWLRVWLIFLTMYWLTKRVVALAERRGYPEKPSPMTVAVLFYLLQSIGGPFLSFLPLLTVVKATNFYWEKEQPNLPIRSNWTTGEIVLIVFGILLWLLIIIYIVVLAAIVATEIPA